MLVACSETAGPIVHDAEVEILSAQVDDAGRAIALHLRNTGGAGGYSITVLLRTQAFGDTTSYRPVTSLGGGGIDAGAERFSTLVVPSMFDGRIVMVYALVRRGVNEWLVSDWRELEPGTLDAMCAKQLCS